MSFASPYWFFLVFAIPIVVILSIYTWTRRSRQWDLLVAKRLQSRLVHPRSGTRFFLSLIFGVIGLILLITSMAMPENGEEWVETKSEGRNILLCFDISQSMLTQDAGAGSRLDAAKGAALEIAERFPSDRIGLLIFSGETQILVPLTIDHTYLSQAIAQLNPVDLPIGGSNLAQAIKDSSNLLTLTGQRNNVMVVLSDGEDHSSGIEAAANTAASDGIFIYTLGFGSSEGDFIRDPRERDGFFRDRRGNKVVSQLKPESLKQVAAVTEGVYSEGAGGNFLNTLDSAVAKMDRFEEEGGHQRIAKPIYQWFLLPGIILLMISLVIRRLPATKAAALAFFGFLLPTPQAEANELYETYSGRNALKNGETSYAHGHFSRAADDANGDRKTKLLLAAGSAAYQEKEWSTAAETFSRALITENNDLRHQAHHALANALFYQGVDNEDQRIKDWQGSVSHFEQALEISDDDATRENLEAVKKLLKQAQQKQEQEEKQDDEKQKQDEEKKDEKSENQKDEKSEDQQQSDQDKGDSEKNQGEKPEPSDEEKEESEKGEKPEPKEGDPEKTEEPGQSDDPKEGEQPQPKPGEEENPEEQEPQEVDPAQMDPQQAEQSEESNEDRARRILRAQADFGGQPPKARRRYLRRPEKDW